MQHVYIDEHWVVDQYMLMEKMKAWNELDSANDMRVLDLERELLAENMGVTPDCLPPINPVAEFVVPSALELFESEEEDD